MSKGSGEKRQFSRVRFDARTTISGHAGQWKSELIDISLKGALVKRPPEWSGAPGERYALEIELGEHADIVIRMNHVTVAHIHPDTIGFSCVQIDVDSIAHLKRLMELNIGDAELIHRELGLLG